MTISPVKYPAYAVVYASNASISGSYLDVYGDHDTLTVDHSYVSGNSDKVTGDYNQIVGSSATVIGDHNLVQGNYELINGDHNEFHGVWSHIYGDGEKVIGNYNQVWGTNESVSGNAQTITLENLNGLDPAKTTNNIFGDSNTISDRDNETMFVSGSFNTLHIAHSDTIWLAGDPKSIVGNEQADTLDFSQAVSGKSDVYGFNPTDTILVGYGESTTVTTLASGFTNLHVAGNGVSYDVVFHDGGADVASHIQHTFFQV